MTTPSILHIMGLQQPGEITFEGVENGRDMGSLVMQDRRTVCFDMLVRSGMAHSPPT